ncbi:MAG: hypothetical protein P4L69_17925 [Desulfosporosinus sp.]|nr:hypothetical protein [Desulfosporosinus sp.]
MNPDVHSVNLAQIALSRLGFPSVREAEQDPSFIKYVNPVGNVLAKPYKKTPDLIAGPNNGDRLDFYIDVHSPDGSMINDRGPVKDMVKDFNQMKDVLYTRPGEKGRFYFGEYVPQYFPRVVDALKTKSEKYGQLRQSKMFGLVAVFDGTDPERFFNTELTMVLYADYIFKWVLPITKFDINANKIFHHALSDFVDQRGKLVTFGMPIDLDFAFYLLFGVGPLGKRGLMLFNTQAFDVQYHTQPVLFAMQNILNNGGNIPLPLV